MEHVVPPTAPPSRLTGGLNDRRQMILGSEVRLNGGLIVVSDQSLGDDRERGPGVGVSCEVPPGQARSICEAFEANGGEALVAPATHSQGEGTEDVEREDITGSHDAEDRAGVPPGCPQDTKILVIFEVLAPVVPVVGSQSISRRSQERARC